jgi:Tol biopolymer transport system component
MRLRLLGWSGNDELLVALVGNEGLNLAMPTEVTLVVLSSSGQERQPRRTLSVTYFCSTHLSQNQRNVSFITAQGGRDNIATLALDGGEMKSLTNNKDDKLYFSSPAWSRDGKTICFSKQTKWSLLTIISNHK